MDSEQRTVLWTLRRAQATQTRAAVCEACQVRASSFVFVVSPQEVSTALCQECANKRVGRWLLARRDERAPALSAPHHAPRWGLGPEYWYDAVTVERLGATERMTITRETGEMRSPPREETNRSG